MLVLAITIRWYWEQRSPHPYKASRKPALTVDDAAPPPLLVCGINHFDGITSLEAKFLDVHGNMVPKTFSIHYTAITDQLRIHSRNTVIM